MNSGQSTISIVKCTLCGKKRRLINLTPEGLNRLNANHNAYDFQGGDNCSGHFVVDSTRNHSVAPRRLCVIPGCGRTTRRHGKHPQRCGMHRVSHKLYANPAAL